VKCQQCGSCDSKVVESRDVAEGDSIRRRRECLKCGYRFTTYERIERPNLVVIKRDGTRELFSREKLLAGLQHASEKTTLSALALDGFTAELERELYARGEPEIGSQAIGELVMERLPALNEVAYVRFASVYRNFRDISSFERELTKIKKSKTRSKAPVKK